MTDKGQPLLFPNRDTGVPPFDPDPTPAPAPAPVQLTVFEMVCTNVQCRVTRFTGMFTMPLSCCPVCTHIGAAVSPPTTT